MHFVYLPEACSDDLQLDHQKLCAIRYLAGVLELPKFWSLKTEGADTGKRLFDFLSRLCKGILRLIQDTEPNGAEDEPSPHLTSARDAVDTLACATFSGFIWLHEDGEELPPYPSQLLNLVSLLTRCVFSTSKSFSSTLLYFFLKSDC